MAVGGSPVGEGERLKLALQWLRSHHKRLALDRRSLEKKLSSVAAEADRVAAEIEQAEARLKELTGGRDGPGR